jgi:hypothetical protein
MLSYRAGYMQIMPFAGRHVAYFHAPKINSTLALIGAIVAEFFGTRTVGIGFPISIETGRTSLDGRDRSLRSPEYPSTEFSRLPSARQRAPRT